MIPLGFEAERGPGQDPYIKSVSHNNKKAPVEALQVIPLGFKAERGPGQDPYIKSVSHNNKKPSFNSSFEYIIPKVIGQVPVTAQTFDISHFPPLFPPVPVELNMQVDQTLVIFADANYHATEKSSPSGELSYTALSGNVMFLIYNMATASILAAEPHNYPTILDVSESHIAINPTLVQ